MTAVTRGEATAAFSELKLRPALKAFLDANRFHIVHGTNGSTSEWLNSQLRIWRKDNATDSLVAAAYPTDMACFSGLGDGDV